MTMLDLQAQFQSARDTTGLLSVRTATHNRKTTNKQNSFNQVLDKASQLKYQKNKKLNSTNQSSLACYEPNNAAKSLLKDNFESQDTTGLMASKQETDLTQLKPEILNQDNLKNNQEQEVTSHTENTELNTALVSEIFQLVDVAADNSAQGSSIQSADQSVDQSTDMLPENESQIQAQSVPGINAESLINVLPSISSANKETDTISIPSLLVEKENPLTPINVELQPVNKDEKFLMVKNDLAISELDVATPIKAGAGKENQLPPPDMINADSQKVNKPGSEQTMVDDLTIGKADASLQHIVQKAEANLPIDQELNLIAGVTETAKKELKISAQQSKQDEAQIRVSVDEAGNSSKIDQEKKMILPQDIRYKILEKFQADKNQKPNNEPPATDVKQLLGEEIERLRVEKSGREISESTETALVKTKPEVFQSGLGAEKSIFSPAKSGLDAQMTRPEVPTPTVDPQDLIEQIVKKVEMVNKAANSEMKIQLKPEFLGKIMIKIAVDEGVVTARFITESQQVKHLLENNLGSLKQNLESQGLKVDRTEVNVQLDNGGAFHGNDSGRQQMWQEYAERNSYNRLSYQDIDDYGGAQEVSLESYGETASANGLSRLGDGKLDFMI